MCLSQSWLLLGTHRARSTGRRWTWQWEVAMESDCRTSCIQYRPGMFLSGARRLETLGLQGLGMLGVLRCVTENGCSLFASHNVMKCLEWVKASLLAFFQPVLRKVVAFLLLTLSRSAVAISERVVIRFLFNCKQFIIVTSFENRKSKEPQ